MTDNGEIYQYIFNELSGFFVDDWEKVVVYLQFGKASYSFAFYVKSNGVYVNCYDLLGAFNEDLWQSFERIDGAVVKWREDENMTWTNMTMIVESSGNMHVDFDYTDFSNGAYEFYEQWEKKYLV